MSRSVYGQCTNNVWWNFTLTRKSPLLNPDDLLSPSEGYDIACEGAFGHMMCSQI